MTQVYVKLCDLRKLQQGGGFIGTAFKNIATTLKNAAEKTKETLGAIKEKATQAIDKLKAKVTPPK